MMFRIFNESQGDQLFLSPYTKVIIETDKLIIFQTLYNCDVYLSIDGENAQKLICCLKDGMKEKSLLSFFMQTMSEEEAGKILNLWIRTGVLE